MAVLPFIPWLLLAFTQASFANASFESCEETKHRAFLIIGADASLDGVKEDLKAFSLLAKTSGANSALIGPSVVDKKIAVDPSQQNKLDQLIERLEKNGKNKGSTRAQMEKKLALHNELVTQLQAIPQKSKADLLREAISAKRAELLSKDPAAEIILTYSGHGTLCDSAEATPTPDSLKWCARIGQQLISEEELKELSQAKGFILDSCYSGRFAWSKSEAGGTFLLASAMGNQLAEDLSGGFLAQTIQQLLEADSESACAVDLDHNGEISERELAAISVLSFWGKRAALIQSKESATNRAGAMQEVGYTKNIGAPFDDRDRSGQVPTSKNVGDRCLLKIKNPKNCKNALGEKALSGSGVCQIEKNKSENLARSLAFLNESRVGETNPLSFLLEAPNATKKNAVKNSRGGFTYPVIEADLLSLTPMPGSSGPTFYDKALSASAKFIADWESDLYQKMSECAIQSADDETCKSVDRNLQNLQQEFENLEYQLLMLSRQSRSDLGSPPPLKSPSPFEKRPSRQGN